MRAGPAGVAGGGVAVQGPAGAVFELMVVFAERPEISEAGVAASAGGGYVTPSDWRRANRRGMSTRRHRETGP